MTDAFSGDNFFRHCAVSAVPGIGKKMAERLEKLGLFTLYDALFHLPRRYVDKTRFCPIQDLLVGQYAVVEGIITKKQTVYSKKRQLIVEIKDASGSLQCRFFHFNKSQLEALEIGATMRAFGETKRVSHHLAFIHPEYTLVNSLNAPALAETLTAIYPTTEGVQQKTLQKIIQFALTQLRRHPLDEWLCEDDRTNYQLPTLQEALQTLHCPDPSISLQSLVNGKHPAQQRLQLDELIAHQLSAARHREAVRTLPAISLSLENTLCKQLKMQLPFALTRSQEQVLDEIANDLRCQTPMTRLLQGDVGSGKTIVALFALLAAVDAGMQGVLMVPTEILAEQHYQNICSLLKELPVRCQRLTGQMKTKERTEIHHAIQNGEIHIIVGTHALIQDKVNYQQLGICIIDEQHRFGVKQRLELLNKNKENPNYPHLLLMTATPIPRTLAMTCFAHLDCSQITELPPGRLPIQTVALPEGKKPDIITRLVQHCSSGQQAYWICTLISESDKLAAQAAETTFATLQAALPSLKIGLLHGKMSSELKDETMRAFKTRHYDLLVATTVIEVGVDVPNATLMIIDNAERLGLAQLHQLRGRVGRGAQQSFCVLLYYPPLSELAKKRLSIMRESHDGFKIASVDLEIRGPGEWLGTQQAGLPQLKIADPIRDQALVPIAAQFARILSNRHTDSETQKLLERWLPAEPLIASV